MDREEAEEESDIVKDSLNVSGGKKNCSQNICSFIVHTNTIQKVCLPQDHRDNTQVYNLTKDPERAISNIIFFFTHQ